MLKDQTRLFERGALLSAPLTDGEIPLGYSLTVVNEVIEQMGGRI